MSENFGVSCENSVKDECSFAKAISVLLHISFRNIIAGLLSN